MNAWLQHQQRRFMRPDARRYWRPDTDRYLAPERKWDGQPRIPEGEDGGGQFTFGTLESGGESSGLPRVYITGREGAGPFAGFGDGEGNSNAIDVWSGLLLAGDLPDGLGGPGEDPPKIPEGRPTRSAQRTAILRALASFLGRNSGPIANVILGAMDQIEWLHSYQDLIHAAKDPPKSMRELQAGVGKRRPGYDDHHIVEKTAGERWGWTPREVDDPSNIVSIPRLKHYQITGWYQRPNPFLGNLSPREYLADKGWEERRRIGLEALELFGVLKR